MIVLWERRSLKWYVCYVLCSMNSHNTLNSHLLSIHVILVVFFFQPTVTSPKKCGHKKCDPKKHGGCYKDTRSSTTEYRELMKQMQEDTYDPSYKPKDDKHKKSWRVTSHSNSS